MKKKKQKKNASESAEKAAETMAFLCRESQATDVFGSWTGTSADGDTPVQDADDL